MLVFLMLAALAAAAGWFWLSGEVSGSRGAAVTQSVTIEKGSGPLAIGQKLQDAGIIRSAQVFRFMYAARTVRRIHCNTVRLNCPPI